MIRKRSPSVLAALCLVVLAACGGQDGPSAADGGLTDGGVTQGSFTLGLSPAKIVAVEGQVTSAEVTVTLTRSDFGDAVAFTLDGEAATGTFEPASVEGNTTTLTLSIPADVPVGDHALTITGTAGSLSQTATLTLSVEPAPITVAGTVTDQYGADYQGATVLVEDVDGPKSIDSPGAITLTDGSFSIASVRPPYKITVTPRAGDGAPLTWAGLSRADPSIGIVSNTNDVCGYSAGILSGTLAAPVAAGHKATVIFVGAGIDRLPALSNKQLPLAAGATSYEMTVDFSHDGDVCPLIVHGRLVYLEWDVATRAFTQAFSMNTDLPAGLTPVVVDVPASPVTPATFTGTVSLPPGATAGNVSLVIPFGKAFAQVNGEAGSVALSVGAATSTFELNAFDPTLSVRLIAYASSPGAIGWVWSDSVKPGQGPVNLALQTAPAALSPSGPGVDPAVTFSQQEVAGASVYLTSVYASAGGAAWTGISSSPSVVAPATSAGPWVFDPMTDYEWQVGTRTFVAFTGDPPGVDAFVAGRLSRLDLAGFMLLPEALFDPVHVSAGTESVGRASFTTGE